VPARKQCYIYKYLLTRRAERLPCSVHASALPAIVRQVGNATIYHENCLSAFRKLDGNSVHFIATDPPYFLDGMDDTWNDGQLSRRRQKAGAVGGLPVGMKFDPSQGRRLQEFFEEVAKEAIRVLRPGGYMVAFAMGRLYHRTTFAAEAAGFEIRDMLVWEHNGGQGKAFTQDHFVRRMDLPETEKRRILGRLRGRKTPQLRPKFESIMLAQKPRSGTFVENWLQWETGLVRLDFEGESQQANVLRYKKPRRERSIDHMTVKPVPLMKRLVEVFTIEDQVVLDPFLGSGTTGVAALECGRRFIGFEKEEKYVRMAARRFRRYA
jgi:site-specific DNA-methyltransferase (adenine-specific)